MVHKRWHVGETTTERFDMVTVDEWHGFDPEDESTYPASLSECWVICTDSDGCYFTDTACFYRNTDYEMERFKKKYRGEFDTDSVVAWADYELPEVPDVKEFIRKEGRACV